MKILNDQFGIYACFSRQVQLEGDWAYGTIFLARKAAYVASTDVDMVSLSSENSDSLFHE